MKKLGLFLLLIFPSICLHELGHLIVGTALGFKAYSFNFGVGPNLISFTAHEILWQIKLIPIAGFVEFPGKINPLAYSGDELKWIAMLVAGVATNLVVALSVILFVSWAIIKHVSLQKITREDRSLYQVKFNFPPLLAKLFIPRINQKFFILDPSTKTILQHPESDSSLWASEGDKVSIINLKPLAEVSRFSELKFIFSTSWNVLTFRYGLSHQILKVAVQENLKPSTSKIVGIFGMGSAAADAFKESHAAFLINFMSINLSLAVLNLLPLYFLDGGSIIHNLWLLITKTDLSKTFLTIHMLVSLLLLIALFFGGIFSDLMKKIKR